MKLDYRVFLLLDIGRLLRIEIIECFKGADKQSGPPDTSVGPQTE